MAAELLRVDHLTVKFGGLTAVNDVDFSIFPGEIVSLIGPNGAGKTTTFNAVTGFEPGGGSIQFGGEELHSSETAPIAEKGITCTFRSPPFRSSVQETSARPPHPERRCLGRLLQHPRKRRVEEETAKTAEIWFIGLEERRRRSPAACPTATSDLEIGIALAVNPNCFSSMNLGGSERYGNPRMKDLIQKMRRNPSRLSVEHDMKLVSGYRTGSSSSISKEISPEPERSRTIRRSGPTWGTEKRC
jgi:branched-chain amino acid transport system ATP-binding protein